MQRNIITKRAGPSLLELEQGLRFSTLDLGTALENQPELFYRAAKRLAHALSERDTAKMLLEQEEAYATIACREDAVEKLTAAEVAAQVSINPGVIAARQAVNEASAEINKVSALKEAYTQRGYALKDIILLQQASGHFDTDDIKQELHQQRQAYHKKPGG